MTSKWKNVFFFISIVVLYFEDCTCSGPHLHSYASVWMYLKEMSIPIYCTFRELQTQIRIISLNKERQIVYIIICNVHIYIYFFALIPRLGWYRTINKTLWDTAMRLFNGSFVKISWSIALEFNERKFKNQSLFSSNFLRQNF